MIPPYGRTPQEVYNDLNEELKTKGFEFDKCFWLAFASDYRFPGNTNFFFSDYHFPGNTNFFFDATRSGKPVIRSCDASADVAVNPFLIANADAFEENPQAVRTLATVTEQLLNGWQYDESLTPAAPDNREIIHFVTRDNKTVFCIKDGDYVRIQDKSDSNDYTDLKCRYVNSITLRLYGDTVLEDQNCCYVALSQYLEETNKQAIRLPARKPAYDVAFTPDGKFFEWKSVPIADEETMIKDLVGDVIKTGGAQHKPRTLFQGTKGTALFGLTSDGKLTSSRPFMDTLKETLSNDSDYRVLNGVFFEEELNVLDLAKPRDYKDVKKCLSDYYEKKAQNSSCVIDTNKATASNTATDTKVASAKKDTGRGR
jgi:hypothetical protein